MRGGQTRFCRCVGFGVLGAAMSVGAYICFELSRLIVGEFLFPVYPAERCALNGKVTVVLRVYDNVDTRDIIRAVLSWDPCLRGLSGW